MSPLYEKGEYFIVSAKPRKGFDVYRNVGTHSVRVSQIGFGGDEGWNRAKAEIDRRIANPPKARMM